MRFAAAPQDRRIEVQKDCQHAGRDFSGNRAFFLMRKASKSSVVKKDVLGGLALALFPLEKLKHSSPRGESFEKEIHDFLVGEFNGYTVSSGNISGHWKDDSGHDHYGEHRAYKAALPNNELRVTFERFLAAMARDMGEECIYTEINGEILLIYQQQG